MNILDSVRHAGISRLLGTSFLLLAGLWIAACGGSSDSLSANPVGAVAIDPSSVPLTSLGDTVRLTAKVTDTDGKPMTGQDITWSSSNASVATVSSSGLVTAVSNGSAIISASTGGVSGNATISIAQEVTSLAVTPPTGTLVSFGETVALTATPKDARGNVIAGQSITWTSSNAAAATVSAAGVVTAVANGSTTVTASLGSFTATSTITVAQVVASVTVTPGANTLFALGATVQLTATPKDANGNIVAGQTPVWVSSNGSIALVGPSGLVTAMAAGGPVTITATVAGKSGTAAVTVVQAVESVQLNPGSGSLASLGETLQLTATALDANNLTVNGVSFTWTSSNSSVATVSATGLVTAVANGGPVTITAAVGPKAASANVTVAQVVASVGVTPGTGTLVSFGETLALTATPADANGHPVSGQTITWNSSNTSIATVSASGLVTAVSNGGPLTITASTAGKSGTASVSVAQVVSSVDVTPPASTLTSLGSTQQLTATPKDANGNAVAGSTVTWTSSNTAVAQVGPTGLVTAMGNGGPVTITASAGGKSATASITVNQSVANVAVAPGTGTLVSVGETLQLGATVTDANGATVNGVTVTWSSSNTAVATVSATGLVTAVANGGPVTITGSVGAKSGTASITVQQAVASVAVAPGTSTLVSFGETVQLTATPADANGHPITGQTITWSSANTATATVSNSGLVTAVANGGPVTITATVGAKSGTATVTVAQAVASVTLTPPTTTLASIGATVQLAAAPKDANGNAVAGQTVAWTSSDNTVATVGPTGLVTALTNGGPVTITATIGTKSGTASVTVAQAVNSVTVTPPTTPLASFGKTVQLTATPLDANGIAITGLTITWTSATPATASVSAAGLVTAVANGGPVTITASTGGKSGTASVTVAQVVASVSITTQPAATVQSGVAFPTVPVVTVQDSLGNGIANSATVAVSVATGAALTFTNGSAITNASGVATFTGLVASGLAGDRTLKFTAGTVVSAASNTVTVSGGAPATVTITTQPSTPVQSGVAFTTVPVVTVTDGAGNPVPNQAVTVAVVTGTALTFTNGSATTDGTGTATFTGLAASGLIGARTLRFTAGTANSAATGSVTVTPGLPATVTIGTQPAATVQTGVVFPNPVPVVTVRDGATNLVPSQAVTVSVATGGALTFTNGTATTSAVAGPTLGQATFTGLSAAGLLGARTLQFTAGTAVSVASSSVNVTAGPPATVTIATQPAATVQSGVVFPTVPVVTVADAGGNPVTGQAVTVAVVTGTALTFTSGSATTDGTGTATFTGLAASGLIGARTLRFTAGTVNSAATGSVTVTPGLPATVTIATQPSATVQTGVAFPVVPIVTVRDGATNLVPNQAVTVAVATGGVLTFTNGSAITSAVAGPTLGQATFTGLSAAGLLGARTLNFTAGTAVSVASTSVNVTAGPPAQIVVTPATSMLLAALATKQLTATVQDAGGNPVAGTPTWTSANAAVATVSATGLVTAGATFGTVTITATSGAVSGTAIVMVGQVALVSNNTDGTVSVLNGTTVQNTLTLGNGPLDLAITPDGSKSIVLNNNGSNFQFVTLGTNAVSAFIGSSNPRGISIEPAGQFAFIVRGALDPSLEVRNVSDGASVTRVVAKAPRYVVATATDAWVTDSGRTATNGQIRRYSRSVGDFTDSVMVGNTPYGIDITPNGQFIYVANMDSNTVSVINTGTLTRVANIAVGTRPWGVKVTPNGQFVYVANSGGNTVSVIATASNTVTATVTVGSNPRGLAITAAGDLVYVANSGCDWTLATRLTGCPSGGTGTVSRIATATNTLSGSNITVGGTPSHIALRNVP